MLLCFEPICMLRWSFPQKLKITPWFHAIAESFLFKWWDRLDEILAQRGLNDTSELTAVHKLDVPEVSA